MLSLYVIFLLNDAFYDLNDLDCDDVLDGVYDVKNYAILTTYQETTKDEKYEYDHSHVKVESVVYVRE